MRLLNSGLQQRLDLLYVADTTITSGGTAQLVLGQSLSRSFLFLQNLDSAPMYVEIGCARATCTISSGKVNSVSVVNAGMGFSSPPVVRFLGGGSGPALPAAALGPSGTPFLGGNEPNYPSPSNFATGHCVMTGSAPNQTVSSIAIDNAGSGYLKAPYVQIYNSPLDPYGSAAPSSTSGFLLQPQGEPLIFNGTVCPTDPIAVLSPTTNAVLICRWLD